MKLFLDDIRQPQQCLSYMKQRIGKDVAIYAEDWQIVRNYDDFVNAVKNNEISHISFDHDLADAHYNPETWTEGFVYHEKTGLDCALFVKEFYHDKPLPIMYVHSMNPVGTQNIINVFK